jgi:hypothetical protein
MFHLSHLKHIEKLELIGTRGLQMEKIALVNKNGEWVSQGKSEYDWFFYLIDEKFVLNHPRTLTFKTLQDGLLATQEIDYSSHDRLLDRVSCYARMCSKLEDGNKNNQRLFMKHLDSTVIVKIDVKVDDGVSFDDLPEQVMLTSEWLHDGKLYWVTNQPYAIFPSRETFNALKINEDTPSGNWHVKLYLRDECFASLSFRIESMNLVLQP